MQAPGKSGNRERGKREQRRLLRKGPTFRPDTTTGSFPFIPRCLQVAAARQRPGVLGPELGCTHLFGNTTSRRPRPPRPPPAAGGMRAWEQPPAGTTGGAALGQAGGAGRARPFAAGPSRAAADYETCRAPPPPPRPLARPRSGARLGPRAASRTDCPGSLGGCSQAPSRAAQVLGKSRAAEPESEAQERCVGTVCCETWRDLQGVRQALRADKAGATKRELEGDPRDPATARPRQAPSTLRDPVLKGSRA